jgi:guanylate kinase
MTRSGRSESKGKLVIISGPSGSGKTTVCEQLTQESNIRRSISVTTRPQRATEKEGEHYHFISRDEFHKRINAGQFAEYAEYSGNLYGTPLDPLIKTLDEGLVCLLEIDVHGALQIREKFPDATTIFLMTPDEKTLEKRLINRNTDDKAEVDERLDIAKDEYEYRDTYKYCIVNDNLDETVKEVRKILELK